VFCIRFLFFLFISSWVCFYLCLCLRLESVHQFPVTFFLLSFLFWFSFCFPFSHRP
jgi:hypothetical protein